MDIGVGCTVVGRVVGIVAGHTGAVAEDIEAVEDRVFAAGTAAEPSVVLWPR